MRAFSKVFLAGFLASSLFAAPAFAEISNYEFQLQKQEAKKSDDAIVEVRLVNKKTGQLIPDAVIFAKRIDMAPDGMETMIMPIEQLSSTEPGIYRFKTQLVMVGKWRLSLGAKIQNENGSLENKLIFKVIP